MKLSSLSEMAVTTGAIAFAPNVTSQKRKSKRKKKQPMGDDDHGQSKYRADPITGKPKQGKRDAGKVLLSGGEEALEEAYIPDEPEPVEDIWFDIKNLLADNQGESLGPEESHELLIKVYEIAKQLDEDSPYVVDMRYLYSLDSGEIPRVKDSQVAFRPKEPAYGPAGFGIYRPSRRAREWEWLLNAIWEDASSVYATLIRDILEKNKFHGVYQIAKYERIPSIRSIYELTVDKWNQKITPKKEPKLKKPGPPIMGLHSGELISDICSCHKCRKATSYEEMCPSGKRKLIGMGPAAFPKSLADIGVEVEEPGLLGRLMGKKPKAKFISPKGRRLEKE